jgi:hypothetical protein
MKDRSSELCAQLLTETREEIARADGKASILLAGAGVAASAVVGGALSSDLTLLGAAGVVQVVAAASALAMLLGIWALGAAVMPNVGAPAAGRVRYFTDVLQYEQSTQKLKDALDKEAELGDERTLHQLIAVSGIVKKKYRRTEMGEWFIAAAVGLAVLGGVLNWRLG